MNVEITKAPVELGIKAAQKAAEKIREAIAVKGVANIILATGTSQFTMLNNLVRSTSIDWSKVTMFHLDEYIGLPSTHPASFRKYLLERFINKVSPLKAFHLINGENPELQKECKRLGDIIQAHPIDVAMIGIGENGHLAFNDPPADFDAIEPYLMVTLDEACRNQQLDEGWFSDLAAVPQQAISMSVQHILKSKHLVVSVPDKRKATAVKGAVSGNLSNLCPASILQTHPACDLFLDSDSASLL